MLQIRCRSKGWKRKSHNSPSLCLCEWGLTQLILLLKTFAYSIGFILAIGIKKRNCNMSVSTGSACSSGSLDISHVLSSIKVPMEVINGTVRFTVGDFTSKEDIDYAVEALVKVVDTLRRVSPVTGKEGW